MKEQMHIYYRTHGGENRAPRPEWYSKGLCLKSILLAFDDVQKKTSTELIILHDGKMKENPEWSNELKTLIANRGDIVELPKKGNSQSCMDAVLRGADNASGDMVLFAEDDYLWLLPGLSELADAFSSTPGHYFTLYDHPVRYQPNYPLGADYSHWNNTIHITEHRHWRSQESTCMTFATTAKTLQEDLEYFEKYKDNGKGSPEDRELFREMQSLGDYNYRDLQNPRLLLGPMPSLNTHVHLPWLAPIIDWHEAANIVKDTKLK